MSGREKKGKSREPELEPILQSPVWWHIHGRKMVLKEFDPELFSLRIEGSAAQLDIILQPDSQYTKPNSRRWIVQWAVRQSVESGTLGLTTWSDGELAAAFGLIDEVFSRSDWLIDRYGGDAASQFGFIRWQRFLNVPCPGTGHDGDPNVSIELDNTLIKTVESLLRSVGAEEALLINSGKLLFNEQV